jgi:CRISPR-associated protein Csb2
MLLAMTTPSGNRSALPHVIRTLSQAELFHRSVVSRLGRGNRVECPELTGKDESDRPLRWRHQHAHTIPVAFGVDDRIDHFLVYSPMGLRDRAQRAIRSLNRTWTKGGVGDLQLAVVASGGIEMLRQLPDKWSRVVEGLLGPPGGAKIWISQTPFVPPKTMDRRASRSVEAQVQAELASRGRPAARRVEVLVDLTRKLRHFVRRRQKGNNPPRTDVGFGIRLEFDEPVCGPLLLGYASHYGLGRFRACDASEPCE